MDNPRRDVKQRALEYRMLHAVEQNAAIPVENVIKLRRSLVIVRFGAINIYRVRPRRRCERGVLAADQAVTPAAGATLARSVAFVADEKRAGSPIRFVGWIHWLL